MTSQKVALLVVPVLSLVLMVAGYVVGEIRERRGRKLYMSETGRTKAQWNALWPSEQREWIRRDADDRELARFADDFRKQRQQKK